MPNECQEDGNRCGRGRRDLPGLGRSRIMPRIPARPPVSPGRFARIDGLERSTFHHGLERTIRSRVPRRRDSGVTAVAGPVDHRREADHAACHRFQHRRLRLRSVGYGDTGSGRQDRRLRRSLLAADFPRTPTAGLTGPEAAQGAAAFTGSAAGVAVPDGGRRRTHGTALYAWGFSHGRGAIQPALPDTPGGDPRDCAAQPRACSCRSSSRRRDSISASRSWTCPFRPWPSWR